MHLTETGLKNEEYCLKVLLDHLECVRQVGGRKRVTHLEGQVKSSWGKVVTVTIGGEGAGAGSRRWFPREPASHDDRRGGTPPNAQIKGPDHLTSDLWPMGHAHPVLAGKDCGLER